MVLNRHANPSIRAALLAGSALVAVAAMPAAAHASAYALAETTIDNLVLSTKNGDTFTSFNFKTDANAALNSTTVDNGGQVYNSTTSAYANGHGDAGIDACYATANCAFANSVLVNSGSTHPPAANNSGAFSPVGKTDGSSYAFAASVIPDTNINLTSNNGNGGSGFLKNIAEANTSNGISGAANSGVTGEQTWTFKVQLTKGDTISVSYDAIVSLIANSTDPDAKFTQASSTVNFKLLNAACTGTFVVGTSFPCQETPGADNTTVQAFTGNSNTYDLNTENGTQLVNGNSVGNPGTIAFTMTPTFTGTFTFEIDVIDSVSTLSIPEPASLGLMGVGLIGLGVATRRRRNQRTAA